VPTLRETEAVGKHLLHHFDGGRTLHIHLGLYGKFATAKHLLRRPSARCGCA